PVAFAILQQGEDERGRRCRHEVFGNLHRRIMHRGTWYVKTKAAPWDENLGCASSAAITFPIGQRTRRWDNAPILVSPQSGGRHALPSSFAVGGRLPAHGLDCDGESRHRP